LSEKIEKPRIFRRFFFTFENSKKSRIFMEF